MQTPPTIHITARTFIGESFPIDVDPTRTVDELKALVVAAGKGKLVKVPGLEYKSHELRDARRVDHYELAANDVLNIMPSSKMPKIALELVREDGSIFDITVRSSITVAKLKDEIKIEEKIAVRQLKIANNKRDEGGGDVITLLEMQDDKAITEYSLEGQKILVNDSVGEAISVPSAIGILVSIDDRMQDAEGNRIGIMVSLNQTLGSFKEVLSNEHSFHCTEYSLILNGCELKDDEQTLGDLGFVEGRIVNAVAAVQFCVTTLAGKDYVFAHKATTRISDIRKLLREVDVGVGDLDDCVFSLDGVNMLPESRTLWDLNIYSGAKFSLKDRRLVTLSIQYFGLAANFHERLSTKLNDKISIDGSASLDDLRAQILAMVPSSAKEIFQPPNQVNISHQRKPLGGKGTIREEGLEGGDVVDITLIPLERTIPGEPEERVQIDNMSRLAAHLSQLSAGYYVRFERLGDLADLENAITTQQQALALTPDDHPHKSIYLSHLEKRYSKRFERLGDLADLENAIMTLQKAIALTPDGHPHKLIHLSNLSTDYSARFHRLGDLADLENAITTQQRALALTPDGHPSKPTHFSNLSNDYSARFQRLGDLADLENAVATQEQALALTPDGHPQKPTHISHLCTYYSARYGRLGDLTDLENAITRRQEALALTPDDHPSKPARLSNLSTDYSARFQRLGDLADLENAITTQQRALALTPDGHPSKPAHLSNLGTCYSVRFKRLGDLADLENSVSTSQQALALTPDGHSHKPIRLSNLSTGYYARFGRLGDLADIENAITAQQQALALTPDDHPHKPTRLSHICTCYFARFERLGNLADLENVIMTQQQALKHTPDGHPSKPTRLSNLSTDYSARFERLGDLADLENAIVTQQQALTLIPDGHPDKPTHLTHLCTCYSARFQRLGNLADLENAIVTQQKALALTPDDHPGKPACLSNLGAAYSARFGRLGDLVDLENAITTLQQAFALTPDGHPYKPARLSNLSTNYSTRFQRLGDLVDLENAITTQQQALALTPDGHPDKPGHLSNLGTGYSMRFERLGDLADLENAITRRQHALALTPDGHPHKPARLSNLGTAYSARFERLGDLVDLENAITALQRAFTLIPDSHPHKPGCLSNLGTCYSARFGRLGDLADLENAITMQQQALALTLDGHPNKSTYLSHLCTCYSARFRQLGDLIDLENVIKTQQQVVALTPDGHPDKPGGLSNLGIRYYTRFERLGDAADLENAVMKMKLAAQSPEGSPRVLLKASRHWATFSLRSNDIPSALEALRTAIEILPEVAWLGLDIASRQDWLAKEKPEELGCMAATCAIRLGRFEEAVELVDMARSVFWQQSSSVRSGLQPLKAERPELAVELETVSKKLDTSSFSGLSTAFSDMDPKLYERRLAYHRDLVLKRESLIKEIRSLPGFELFLKPTPFNRLCGGAITGHVVIINISTLGTDALVFDRTNPIRHVPLSKVDVAQSFKHAADIELRQIRADDTQDQERSLTLPEVLDRIDVNTLKLGQETDTTSDGVLQRQARADVTEDRQRSLARLPRIWKHILKPIFTENGLGISLQRSKDQIPTNRIFWYLTGPLAFVPIHAAGPVSQLAVSSYVTTLSSLAEAQKRQSEAISEPPMLLAISQPDTPKQARIPYATDEVDNVMQTVSAAGWPEGKLQRFDRADATIDQVSAALDTCSWVHFACHAMQDTRDGMESAFILHNGRLKLSVIAAKRLASARLAFLSTCQSASGLQSSPGEAIHLSAGMQFAGFSSVVGTMWNIQDKDAPVIAQHTYGYLLRNGLHKVDLKEAAAALNYAVSRLREDPTVTMERWAPFVYYGV